MNAVTETRSFSRIATTKKIKIKIRKAFLSSKGSLYYNNTFLRGVLINEFGDWDEVSLFEELFFSSKTITSNFINCYSIFLIYGTCLASSYGRYQTFF